MIIDVSRHFLSRSVVERNKKSLAVEFLLKNFSHLIDMAIAKKKVVAKKMVKKVVKKVAKKAAPKKVAKKVVKKAVKR